MAEKKLQARLFVALFRGRSVHSQAIIPSTCKVLKRLKKYVLKSYLRWEENIHVQRVDSCLHNTTSAQLLRGVGGSLIWVVTQYF